jgi:hypothetical protein
MPVVDGRGLGARVATGDLPLLDVLAADGLDVGRTVVGDEPVGERASGVGIGGEGVDGYVLALHRAHERGDLVAQIAGRGDLGYNRCLFGQSLRAARASQDAESRAVMR